MLLHSVEETFCIDGINIKGIFMSEPPYVKTIIESKEITDVQKDLIYRLLLEERFLSKRNTYYFEALADNIEFVLSNRYDELYNAAIRWEYSTVVSYLLSNFLVKKGTVSSNKHYILPPICTEKCISSFRKFYSSLMDINIIITEPEIFEVEDFSAIIKYPDWFIDNNFKEFCGPSWNELIVFNNLEIQKPPFEVLARHIGEFDVGQTIAENEYLTDGQIEGLILLENMIVGK